MVMTIEERRWLVVGIVMNKVAAPVLRDYIKQGMDTHYTNLDTHCSRLAPPCTLTTLTYHQVKAHPNLRTLKFQNINKNIHLHGKSLYNHRVNDPVDLAKLYLPEYLAQFSAFDESLDISAILRLLGFSNPTPIFSPPNPFILIQSSADDVRNNVRNKWGHCNFSDWTEAFFKDCFVKLETLVRSLGLTGGKEKTVLDELSDWQTKGCQLSMGHAVDQQLLSLVQQDVKDLRANFVKTQAELSALQELVDQQRTELLEVQDSISHLRVEHAATQVNLREHEEQIGEIKKWREQQIKEVKEILEKLYAAEKAFEEEIRMRLQQAETRLAESDVKVKQLQGGLAETDEKVEQLQEGLAETDGKVEQLGEGLMKVEQLQEGLAKTDVKVEQLGEELMKVEQLQGGLAKTDVKVEQLQEGLAETDEKVEQLGEELMKVEQRQGGLCDKVKELELVVGDQRMKPNVVECRSVGRFDVETCRCKLAEHYRRTATVPTSVWSRKCPVDMQQIYTRLTWVKQEQTPEGLSKPELNHYTEVFDENEKGYVSNRILVQGETGIGKTTFVKKMGLDWAELVDERTIDKQSQDAGTSCEAEESASKEPPKEEVIKVSVNGTNALKRFELVLVINLKEVSKYSGLRDVICHCNIFPEEDTAMAEQLLDYITNNQEEVLLVFDGYDEYRCGMNSEIYEIFRGKKLRNCCVLITTRTSKADDLLGEFKVVHAEITGFSFEERMTFMCKMLGGETEARELVQHLCDEELFGLARVPLLLLFFCTLWKKGKSNSFPETKTKLYYGIVQYVLDHSQRKGFPARFHKLDKYKDILVEIGKVALECLLKDDHVFEFDQLSVSILCEESVFIGLLQVTEFSESLRPAGMVSFIHKSIQEFLAAWYITYKCVPEGDLGEIRDKARTLKDCRSLENVFQFICGLSDVGAVKVFQHLASVRIANSTLDLSKTLADITNERNLTLSCVTYNHTVLSELVCKSFQEVESKPELLNHFFDCTGRIVLVTRQLTELLKKMKLKHSTKPLQSDVVFLALNNDWTKCQILQELAKCLECLQIPLKTSETSTLEEFLVHFQKEGEPYSQIPLNTSNTCKVVEFSQRKVEARNCHCNFTSILHFCNDQFQFNVTSFKLCCPGHISLFPATDSTYKYLNSITFEYLHDPICDILESVPSPNKCTLTIRNTCGSHLSLASARKIGNLIPRFSSNARLNLGFSNSSAAKVEALVTGVTTGVKLLEGLLLVLTPPDAATLGRLLPEMSALENLWLVGTHGSVWSDEEMETLFGGFNKRLPLRQLCLSHFSVTVSLYPLIKILHFFPNMQCLRLVDINLNGQDLCQLLRSLEFIPSLEELTVEGKRQRYPDLCLASCKEEVYKQDGFIHNALKSLVLSEIELTPAAAVVLGRLIPEMPSLEKLAFTWGTENIRGLFSGMSSGRLQSTRKDGSILEAGQVEALFAGVNKPLPLRLLTFGGFTVKGCLAPLAESFQFFPHIQTAELNFDFVIDDNYFPSFLERLKYISHLLRVQCEAVTNVGSAEEVNTVGRLKLQHGYLCLYDITLTPRAASALGRLLPEITTLQQFVFTAKDGNALEGKNIEALFGQCRKELPLRELILKGIILTPKTAAALGRQLPGLSSLVKLEFCGVNGSVLSAKEMEALFGGLNKTLPLVELSLRCFFVTGCLAAISKCLRFLPDLQHLTIDEVTVDEHNVFHLLSGMKNVPKLKNLRVEGKSLKCSDLCSEKLPTDVCFSLDALHSLFLHGVSLTPEAAAALGKLLPELSSLEFLALRGIDGTFMEKVEIDSLFGRSNQTFPSEWLEISGFHLRSCLAPLTGHLCCIPDSTTLMLDIYISNSDFDLCGFLDTDLLLSSCIAGLRSLRVSCNALNPTVCNEKVSAMSRLNLDNRRDLTLLDINLTPAVASAIGRALSNMSSLNDLVLVTREETGLNGKEVDALFGGFQETLPLQSLTFRGFRVRGCLAPLAKSFLSFPNLHFVDLDVAFNSGDLQNLCGFLKSLSFMKFFNSLSVQCEAMACPNGTDEMITVGHLTAHGREMSLSGITLTPAVAAALGESLSEMSSLKTLWLTGGDGCILNAEDIEALLVGVKETSPLQHFKLSGFRVRGFPSPLAKSLSFFTDLRHVTLNVSFKSDDVQNVCGFLECLGLVKNPNPLSVQCEAVAGLDGADEANAVGRLTTSWGGFPNISLSGITLTPAAAAALGQSLGRMSSLRFLKFTGGHGCIINAKEIEALFGGFQETSPLQHLSFSGFRARGFLAPLSERFSFFPDFHIEFLDVAFTLDDEQNVCGFFKSLRFMGRFTSLCVKCEEVASLDRRSEVTIKDFLPLVCRAISLKGITLTSEAAAALGRSLCEMSSLEFLTLTGGNWCIMNTEDIETLFGGFQETLHLYSLTFSGFRFRGCLTLLTRGLNYFVDSQIEHLYISFCLDDPQNVCGFLERLRFMKSFTSLSIQCEAVACSDIAVKIYPVADLTKKFSRKVEVSLSGITLTPLAAAFLGQSLCEMSSLETLKLTGRDGCILDSEQIEALFSGFQETLPLSNLTFSGFFLRGCLAPLAKSFRFFPDLDSASLLLYFNSGDLQIVIGFLENFRFMKCFNALRIQCKEIACPDGTDEENAVSCLASQDFSREILLSGITLTPVAAVLGRSLREMSFLEGLSVTGGDWCALNAVEV
ncbi:uncharacterized protein LOC111327268 isoform X1 [Stylophora pistillata]|nr:uncharacterized protein LOC111327268 isoform X1 [Stylophora pistillata]